MTPTIPPPRTFETQLLYRLLNIISELLLTLRKDHPVRPHLVTIQLKILSDLSEQNTPPPPPDP